jgi:hypothetical protein
MIDNLKESLHQGICEITFEKVDGSIRTLKGTLKGDYIPQRVESKSEKKRKDIQGVIPVYSIDDNGWRSFKEDSILSYRVL